MNPVFSLLVAAVLIAGNGFFVGVEFALLAARQTKLAGLGDSSRSARTALRARQQLPTMIAGCQFGITLCSLGLGAVAEPALSHLLEPVFAALRVPAAAVRPVGVALALLVTSALHMLLGEMVPKNVALAGPERAAAALAPLLVGFIALFRPVIAGLTAVANAVLRLFNVDPVDEGGHTYTAEQVAELVGEARCAGLLGSEEHEQVVDALDFQERTARSVTMPLTELITVPPHVSAAQIERLVTDTGYSRFPVRRHRDGALLGYVHLGDVLQLKTARNRPVPASAIRELPSVPADAPLHEVLATLQLTAAHLAQVLDGRRTVGVVSLEDVLEELVGEVRDATRRAGPA